MAEVLALTKVTTTLAEATPILVGVTTPPVKGTKILQEITTPLTILEVTTVHTVILLPILALFLLKVQTAPLLPTAMQMLLTRVQVVLEVVMYGVGGAKDQDMTSRTAGQQGASTQSRQVSFSSDAYHHAYAVSTADAQLPLQSSAVYASTDLADILAGIGTPLPCNAMPDPAAFNTDVAVDPKGHINALSCSGPKMMFN